MAFFKFNMYSKCSSPLVALVLMVGVSATIPSSGSYAGRAGGACSSCHSGTTYPTLTYWNNEPWVEAGTSDYMYIRIQSNSGALTQCGFNAYTNLGSLSPTSGDYSTGVRQVGGDEVTHTAPQAESSSYCRFAFDFDAPSTSGTATITTWGNNVNGNVAYDGVDSATYLTTTIAVCTDNDGDGNYAGPAACPDTSDCNDNNPNRSYLQSETCDGIDNDCDGVIDDGVRITFYRDLDGDGYGNPSVTSQACTAPVGYVSNNTDCDDSEELSYPGNTEVCDGIDNNCVGGTDEGVQTTYYRDLDVDGYGNPLSTTTACSQPGGYVSNSNDCNDSCNTCYPGRTEVCDGFDNNCVGGVDESTAADASTWYRDIDGDEYGNAGATTKACTQPAGYVATSGDCADTDPARHPGHAEWCDDKDNDCSGATAVDVGCDDDNDDHCDVGMTTVGTPTTCQSGSSDCADNDPVRHPGHAEWCDNKDNDCSGATAVDVGCDDDNDNYCDSGMTLSGSSSTCPNGGGDCDDDCVTCYPGRAEVCDGEDNDCNTQVDDDIQSLTCGQGICEAVAAGCVNGVPQSCTPGTPGTETCNNAGTDDDCDGDENEISHTAVGNPIYVGSSGCDSGLPGICGPGTYYCQGTSVACTANVSPGTEVEVCDDVDNDCDGAIDEGCDDDNDNYCDENITVVGAPATCTQGGGDCNDNPAGGGSVNPGAIEACTNLNVDNDCDGDASELEEDVHGTDSCTSSSPGICAPGNPTCQGSTLTCTPIVPPGSVSETCDGEDDDCDGVIDDLPDLTCGQGACANTAVACSGGFDNVCTPLQGSNEICDNIDNDCDGSVDEGCDDDNDNYCDAAMNVSGSPSTCTAGGDDCDDTSPSTYPNAGELCDSEDNDCDGTADEAEDIALAVCGQGICQRTGTTCEPSSCTPGNAETEICDDLDNDCDGDTDEGCDDDGDGYCDDQMPVGELPAVCPNGGGDCDDTSPDDNPAGLEVCDAADNDCDGGADEVDEVPLSTCGVGFCARVGATCEPTSCVPGSPLPEICDGVDNDCDGLPDDGLPLAICGEGACQTEGSSCRPSSCIPLEPADGEICDAVDNDCDGKIDEGCDDDGDGYCDLNLVYVSTPVCPFGGDDCNDLNADTYPGAVEICDGKDNDCQACDDPEGYCPENVDDDITEVFCGLGECRREGVACEGGEATICEDVEGDPFETCDGLDNDCNGIIDDNIEDFVCGQGECMVVVPGCAETEEPDCDALALPPTDEICDGLDNDCDGRADENPEDLCEDGLCVAAVCVSNDDLEDAGLDPDDYDGYDDDLLLDNTAGASQGGAATLPEAPPYEPPEALPEDSGRGGSAEDRGSCSILVPGGAGAPPVTVLLLLAAGLIFRRRRGDIAKKVA